MARLYTHTTTCCVTTQVAKWLKNSGKEWRCDCGSHSIVSEKQKSFLNVQNLQIRIQYWQLSTRGHQTALYKSCTEFFYLIVNISRSWIKNSAKILKLELSTTDVLSQSSCSLEKWKEILSVQFLLCVTNNFNQANNLMPWWALEHRAITICWGGLFYNWGECSNSSHPSTCYQSAEVKCLNFPHETAWWQWNEGQDDGGYV